MRLDSVSAFLGSQRDETVSYGDFSYVSKRVQDIHSFRTSIILDSTAQIHRMLHQLLPSHSTLIAQLNV
jgi:hypothetical protein